MGKQADDAGAMTNMQAGVWWDMREDSRVSVPTK